MKINLSKGRKPAIVQGTIARSTDDLLKNLWDAYNNLVIAWLMNDVTNTIARSILFVKGVVKI